MNMYGWTTWGRIEDPRESYKKYGTFQLFKHWTGPVVAVPESMNRNDAFLMLAQMNEHLEDVGDNVHRTYEQWKAECKVRDDMIPFITVRADAFDTNEPYDVPCGSDHCTECKPEHDLNMPHDVRNWPEMICPPNCPARKAA